MADQSQADNPQKKSRYERVKKILNDAQGDANPSYQGHKRFWNLPLEEFLSVTIYGVRMIAAESAADVCDEVMQPAGHSCCGSEAESAAPAADTTSTEPSCCESESTAQTEMKPSRGRGAASGLIKGLKGEFPYDGTQFPRLPWSGKAVGASDIIFIESWIDDGCPATDEPAASSVQVNQPLVMARAQGHEEHPLSTKSINEFSSEAGKTKVRKNIECLTADELERFRHVVQVMKCYDKFSRYDQRSFRYWADIHANNCQHGWEQFLSWHRLYLYYFEQQMEDIDPTVTLPYWDWTLYRDDVLKSIEDMKASEPKDNGTVPRAYRCWVDETMLNNLKGKIPDDVWGKLKSVAGQPFNSANRLYDAAKITYGDKSTDDLIIAALENVNPLWHRYRWPGGNKDIIFEAYPTSDDVDRILQIQNFFSFASGPASNHFFGAVENIHNLLHNFSGGANPNFGKVPGEQQYGDMISAGTTARDPIFWGHHSNVDRLWSEWQRLHPGADPDDPNDILAPWPNSVKDVLTISDLGYEYMKSSYLFETNSAVPIARFKSAAATVHPAVLANHSRAEIRIHKVQYSTASGAFVRVFLNEPAASADTPIRDNDHFVAQVATFSGECIGGPGHCDVPPEKKRKYDERPRHRKTPGNFRIDATEAIRKLTEQGATDFQVNLVVLDIDGTPKPNALWMAGVSLNFKD
ncbi:MAG TPA: tyrosinase family protein [Pyrinomonadaceae bacterium]|jgi:tyrosinase